MISDLDTNDSRPPTNCACAALSEMGLKTRHEPGLRRNNRAENSPRPTRRSERKMQRFKSTASAPRSLSVHNTFNVQRHLTNTLRVLRDEVFRTR